MLLPNLTTGNTLSDDIYTNPSELLLPTKTGNSYILLPPDTTTMGFMAPNISISIVPPLDFSQLLYQPECPDWVPLNHIYYQIANLFLLLASLAPNCSAALIFLRTSLVVSFSLSMVWGWTVACALDTAAWSCLLTLVNAAWCVQMLWRQARQAVRLSPQMEEVYMQLFKHLNLSMGQFQVRYHRDFFK